MKKAVLTVGILFLLALGVLFRPVAARSQDISGGEAGVFDLGEVVVKGKAETITSVGTVDEVDVERVNLTNSRTVSDALTTLPGTYLNVGNKNERNIIVRGFNQRYVPVFFDGIPIYLPYDGFVDTGNLTTGNISKITLTKGISSVLYGFNTMAGVINIVSRKPEERFEGDYWTEFREGGTILLNSNVGSRLDDFYFTLGGGILNSKGFPLSNDFEPTEIEDGGRRDNSDIDDRHWSAKVGYMPWEGHEYALGVQHVDLEKGLPPNTDPDNRPRFWRFTEWEKDTYYFIGDTAVTDRLSVKTRLYRDEYYNVLDSFDNATYTTQFRPFAFHSTYDDYSYGGSVILRTDYIPRNLLSLSFHYKDDVHEEQDDLGDPWERYEQEMFSYGIENDIKFTENLAMVLGLSYDVQSPVFANGGELRDDEESYNPQAGIRWTVFGDTDLRFAVARKTRFPTLFELYSGQLGGNVPNPNLESEKSTNYEAGIEKPLPLETRAGLAVFYSDVEDLIVEKRLPSGQDRHENLGEASFKGAEVFLRSGGLIPDNTFELHYTYLDAEDESPDRTSDHIDEVSQHKIYLTDLYRLNDIVSFFAKVEWNSDRWFEDFNTGQWKTLDDFWLVDSKVILTPMNNFAFEAGIMNLLDENYELSDGFPREGRTFFVTMRGTF